MLIFSAILSKKKRHFHKILPFSAILKMFCYFKPQSTSIRPKKDFQSITKETMREEPEPCAKRLVLLLFILAEIRSSFTRRVHNFFKLDLAILSHHPKIKIKNVEYTLLKLQLVSTKL